eukprot:8077052-Alexandrium_andersonii.AAC.1
MGPPPAAFPGKGWTRGSPACSTMSGSASCTRPAEARKSPRRSPSSKLARHGWPSGRIARP